MWVPWGVGRVSGVWEQIDCTEAADLHACREATGAGGLDNKVTGGGQQVRRSEVRAEALLVAGKLV